MLMRLFRKLKLYYFIIKRYIFGKFDKHANHIQITERGIALAEYCGRVILTNGAYEPTTYAEQMLEADLREQYPTLDRLSAVSTMFITLLPYLPLDSSMTIVREDEEDEE